MIKKKTCCERDCDDALNEIENLDEEVLKPNLKFKRLKSFFNLATSSNVVRYVKLVKPQGNKLNVYNIKTIEYLKNQIAFVVVASINNNGDALSYEDFSVALEKAEAEAEAEGINDESDIKVVLRFEGSENLTKPDAYFDEHGKHGEFMYFVQSRSGTIMDTVLEHDPDLAMKVCSEPLDYLSTKKSSPRPGSAAPVLISMQERLELMLNLMKDGFSEE